MQYCVYLIIYSGNKLPPFYIGSSSLKRIKAGYLGSVGSKKFKDRWKLETTKHPEKFKISVIKLFSTRQEALDWESKIQIQLGVVRNSLYVNMSSANVNGMCGMDVAGKLNPNYGNKWDEEDRKLASKRTSQFHKENPKVWATLYIFNKPISKHIYIKHIEEYIHQGWHIGKRKLRTKKIKIKAKENFSKMNSVLCSCLECRKIVQAHTIYHHYNVCHSPKIEFKGAWFSTWKELKEVTGVSKFRYDNVYLKGFDPTSVSLVSKKLVEYKGKYYASFKHLFDEVGVTHQRYYSRYLKGFDPFTKEPL